MYTDQDAHLAFPFRWRPLLEAISSTARNTIERIRAGHEAARREHAGSELPPHLRYDIGEIDHCPPPLTLRQIEHSQQQLLEVMRQTLVLTIHSKQSGAPSRAVAKLFDTRRLRPS